MQRTQKGGKERWAGSNVVGENHSTVLIIVSAAQPTQVPSIMPRTVLEKGDRYNQSTVNKPVALVPNVFAFAAPSSSLKAPFFDPPCIKPMGNQIKCFVGLNASSIVGNCVPSNGKYMCNW